MSHDFHKLESTIQQGCDAGLHTFAQVYLSQHGKVLLDDVFPRSVDRKETMSMLWMSAGKPITAAAVLHLVEHTTLELDDPVMKWIPEFGVKGKEPITVWHLLTHTGGFRGADMQLMNPRPFPEALIMICETPLEPRWVPGEKAGYHMNSSWILLAALIERCAEQPFESFIQATILDPAGMTQTRYRQGEGTPAQLYDTSQGTLVVHEKYTHPEFHQHLRPGSNVCGPAADLARFYECLWFTPEKFGLSVALRDRMISRQRTGMKDASFRAEMDWGLGVIPNSWQYGGATIPYGYGPFASASAFGHGGSQSTLGFVDPDHGLVGAILFDGMPGDAEHQVRMNACMEAVYQSLGLD